MYEEREDIARIVGALWEAFATLRRGDVMPNAEIEAIVGVPPNVHPWQHCMDRVRRRLLDERQIATLWVPGVGCKLLRPDEQLDMSVRRRRKASRQIARGIREVRALPESMLTLAQQFQRVARLDALRREHRELKAQQKVDAVLARPSETLPRAPRRQASSA